MSKILIVDDEKDIILLVKARLEAAHYEVVHANDGEQGLYIVKLEKPDLVILDVMMPVIDGYEVCMRIKRDQNSAHIPVIILTAGAVIAHNYPHQYGADAYISKMSIGDLLMKEVEHLCI